MGRAFVQLGLLPSHAVIIIGANSPQWAIASVAASIAVCMHPQLIISVVATSIIL